MAKITRKIPAAMATQHPDHAGRPYWHKEPFIPTLEEARECFLCFADLGIDEYKWDWEGKLVDEAVLERLLAEHYDYFKSHPLGKEKFLTFRLPNPKVQTEFRMGRALMGLASAAGLARQLGLYSPPLFEVILPMTETAEEMIDIQEAFSEIAHLKHPLYNHERSELKHIEIVPLFESVRTIIRSTEILQEYLKLHKWKFGFFPKYLRPYVARSDPALNSGIVPTVLAIKIALSRYRKFEKKHRLKLFPVIGVGTLPFRGGINPEAIQNFIGEYKGVRTAIIQSAFRYDFSKATVKKAIAALNARLPKSQARIISENDQEKIIEIIKPFERFYQQSVEKISPLINNLAKFLPRRRERVQHIGLFGYSRGMGKVRLPRAISFTAVLYSLGVPPELIGTGRGLAGAMKQDKIKLIETYYVNLKKDLSFAGGFLYKPGLIKLAQKSPAWKGVWQDAQEAESYLGREFSAQTPAQKQHQKLSFLIHKNLTGGRNLTKLMEKAAVLRKSMG